ncbi:MAG: DNA polymerase III subunit delta, partial [Porphyromonadaceae bacterium]|nr:DNA polymerase III subunit delta [Porphyromonadaceae bacterium]
MAQKEFSTHIPIITDIRRNVFYPLYLLMGEEPYYIDLITEEIIRQALKEEERDFNQTIVYGADTNISTIINASRRYPIMSERQLVVVKELQMMQNIDGLLPYLQNPQPSTVLVLNYKNGVVKNKKILAEVNRQGIVYESKKTYDNQLPDFIDGYVQDKNITIENNAIGMLCEAIGPNLSRMAGEIDKLVMLLSLSNEKRITADLVEQHIGISKEYNNTELVKAISQKDMLKAYRIIKYYEQNSKSEQPFIAFSVLFNFFSNLLILHYSSCLKNSSGIASEIGVNRYDANNYIQGLKRYNAKKCVEIISEIRSYDAQAKGVERASDTSIADLL